MRSWRRAHEKFLFHGDWWWVARWRDDVPEDDEVVRLSRWEAADLVARWCDDLHIWPRMLELYQEEFGRIYRAPSSAQVDKEIKPALRRAFERGELVAVREPRKRIAFGPPPDDPPPLPPGPRPPVRQKHYLDLMVQYEDGSGASGRRYRLQLPDARTQEGLLDFQGRIFNPDVPEGTAWFWVLPNKAETIAGEDVAPPTPAPTDTQTFTVRLVDELGVPIPGVPFAIQHSGASETVATDGDGQAQIADDAAQTVTVSFADPAALREALRDRWNAPRDGDVLQASDEATIVELHGDLPSIDLAPGVTQTVSVQTYVERGRLIGGYFDTSKCFLLPSGLDGVRATASMYGDNDGAALLFVGHTDSTGAADYNDRLSLERANALKDYLTQNVDGWLPWYGTTQPAEKRWGVAEDEAMIGALPDAGTRDGSESPIAWYRRTRGMAPGAKPDKSMRQALIGEYMALEGTSLPEGISVVTHGCGENFPADAVPDGVADPDNRRVEVFFFDGVLGVQPPPPGDNSGPGAAEYPEWVRRARRTADHHVPGNGGDSFDLPPQKREWHPQLSEQDRLESEGSAPVLLASNDPSFIPVGRDSPTPSSPSGDAVPLAVVSTPARPTIIFDHGFLDDGHGGIDNSKRRDPTASDYVALAKWTAKLRGAQILRGDLIDATDAYEHFLFAQGTDWEFNYDSFVDDDSSGQVVLQSAIQDVRAAAIAQHEARGMNAETFQIQSQAIGVGGESPRYPYPATEDWQKAIGAHAIWLEASVTVTLIGGGLRAFSIDMVLHAEDMYNFNPGAKDIATGTPDAENGRFEVTGLAHEFRSVSTLKRNITFTEPLSHVVDPRQAAPNQVVTKPR